MWLKLGGLVVLIAALCLLVLPIRTHAVMYDPSKPPRLWTLKGMVANMYLTPTAGLLIAAILAGATFVAFKVIRGQW
jgi:hypothetical protein